MGCLCDLFLRKTNEQTQVEKTYQPNNKSFELSKITMNQNKYFVDKDPTIRIATPIYQNKIKQFNNHNYISNQRQIKTTPKKQINYLDYQTTFTQYNRLEHYQLQGITIDIKQDYQQQSKPAVQIIVTSSKIIQKLKEVVKIKQQYLVSINQINKQDMYSFPVLRWIKSTNESIDALNQEISSINKKRILLPQINRRLKQLENSKKQDEQTFRKISQM